MPSPSGHGRGWRHAAPPPARRVSRMRVCPGWPAACLGRSANGQAAPDATTCLFEFNAAGSAFPTDQQRHKGQAVGTVSSLHSATLLHLLASCFLRDDIIPSLYGSAVLRQQGALPGGF